VSSSRPVQDFELVGASKPSSGETHEFRIVTRNASGTTSMDTRITIRDGWDEIRAEGDGEVVASLPKGLYTVRLERAGVVVEHVVRHTGDTSRSEMAPARASALPSFDTVNAHEYYSYTAHELSKRDTGNAASVLPDDGSGAGRLFLFVRAAEYGSHGGRDLADPLFLDSLDGLRLTDFTPNVVEQDHDAGWLAFSAPARAGSYVLRTSGLGARDMVVSVFAGWETQLFIPFEHRPRLERASVLVVHAGSGFHPDDRVAQAIDAGLSGLRSGMNLLPPEERQMLLYGKFENPMLGLIGAHLLLLEPEPNWNLLRIVIMNLERLLPGSADVHAVRLAAAMRHGGEVPPQPVTAPPMLHRGMMAIMEGSAVRPEIVPEAGFIERIAPHLLADSAWTTWSLPSQARASAGWLSRVAEAEVEHAVQTEAGALEAAAEAGEEPFAVDTAGAMRITRLALPEVLSRAGPDAGVHLSQALDESSRPGAGKLLEHARSAGAPAVRRAMKQLVMDGVDAAVRASSEQEPRTRAAAELPVWVQELLRDARTRGTETDLGSIARQARLPLGMLQRALKHLD
jgi:hypothetical protein